MLRIFGLSIATTVVSLTVAFFYGMHGASAAAGGTALAVCAILGVVEVALSFDNAVVNAIYLDRLNERWQRIFLTVGVLIAAFGMRFILPLAVVWITAGLAPGRALHLAFNPPAHHATHYADGTPSYETYLHNAHPLIASFGGMFLLLLFLTFVFEEREVTWLSWVERPLARAGRLDQMAAATAFAALVVVVVTSVPQSEQTSVLIGGIIGGISYILINGAGEVFNTDESETGTVMAKLAGRAAFATFMYLEVLDASFSFDGVMGAFAITTDPVLIVLGLGFIGAIFVRSLTVLLVRRKTLAEYVFLEHGAMWAIGALAAITLISIHVEVNDLVTGLVSVALIGAAFLTSVVHRKRNPAGADADAVALQPSPTVTVV